MNRLNSDAIFFNMHKIKAHTKPPYTNLHLQYNAEVDTLAKEALHTHTQPLQPDASYYECYFNNNTQYVNAYHYHQYDIQCLTYQ